MKSISPTQEPATSSRPKAEKQRKEEFAAPIDITSFVKKVQVVPPSTNTTRITIRGLSGKKPKKLDMNGPAGSRGKNNWLFRCPEAMAALDRGLAESKLGLGVEMDFSQYADLKIEE